MMRRGVLFILLLIGSMLAGVASPERREEKQDVGTIVQEQGRVLSLPVAPCPSLLTPRPSHRVVSPRPSRYVPTGSGKTNGSGRGTVDAPASSYNHFYRHLRQGQAGLRAALAPPRFYYVIALRRILC